MAVDPYALCPCGSGKKLKFCCSDLVTDIEKIHRMIEGDQPRAALRHVEQALAQHAGRASLLDLKATLELSLEEFESARQTVEQFVETHPDSPSAHACHALYLAAEEQARPAVAALQRALGMVEREMPQRVFEAIGTVGRALLVAGHVVAAQAHLWLHAALAPSDDRRALELLVSLNRYSGLPLLLRDQLRLRPWPADATWREEADAASHLSSHGKWQAAAEMIDRLGQRYGADPALVYNRAVVGGWLADERTLVAGLHAFAEMDVPLDEAVEAESIAQLLDSDLKEQAVDSLALVYEISDLDALVARLTADARIEPFELDPGMFSGDDRPPPRYAYVLLDRPLPASGTEITRHDVPRLAGVVAVYGRQTDRRERLELTVDRGPDFDSAVSTLCEIAGDALADTCDERVIGSVTPTEQVLNWRWHFPRGTPREARLRMVDEERRAAVTERWPEVPRPALGGQSPRQASADPALRIRLLAAVLVLEQGGGQETDPGVFAQLRDELGLPQPEPIDPADVNLSRLPLARVPRLQLERVSDDDLVQLYRRAILAGADATTAALARQAVRRESLADKIPPDDAYQRLIASERDPARAMEWIDEARQRSQAAGTSTVPWDLAELELYVSEGAADKAQAALERIEALHRDDPQVTAAVYRMLYEAGAISPDDVAEDLSLDEAGQTSAMDQASQPAASRIWTPGSDRPSGGKSTLWTPP